MKNIALDFGWNGEKEETYNTEKIAAISSEFDFDNSRRSRFDSMAVKNKNIMVDENGISTRNNSAEYTTNTYSTDNFKEANLFRFQNEFNFLKEQSSKIANLSESIYGDETEVTSGKITVNNDGDTLDSVILKGSNKKLNVFTITASEFNNLIEATGGERALTFDVPAGSYVIVNITGTEQVDFNGSMLKVYYPMSKLDKDLYLKEQDDLGYLENSETVYRRISSGDSNGVEVENNEKQAQYILYNVVDSNKFTIKSNWVGTILAPSSNGSDNGLDGKCDGHLSGTLICNSYEGYEQFGYVPFTLGIANVDIDKIESENKKALAGAQMAIYYFEVDEEGNIVCNDENLVYEWTTTEETESVILPTGGYILKELSTPVGYEKADDKYLIFEVKEIMNYSGNEEEYGTFSFEDVVAEGYEYIEEVAVSSAANKMWTPAMTSAYVSINISNYIRI